MQNCNLHAVGITAREQLAVYLGNPLAPGVQSLKQASSSILTVKQTAQKMQRAVCSGNPLANGVQSLQICRQLSY